ncbi:MAG: glycoside hydrolase family 57 protein [Deltaproteobacteria bacterium]|nr:glycoside hydrolase family 57 protein [Deltaproteobacteria bacterium]
MKLYVCFLWHMHQPYYKDPETGTHILPWVRLHAIKDYAALPRIFRRFPSVRHTFNLVPSLLVQLRDYVENGAEDAFLTVSRKNALDLSRDEEEFLLRNFFSCFPPTMILPQPRYAELYNRREEAERAIGRAGSPGGFGASEYTDLMTLFNLAWFHPLHREEDPELGRLWRKGRGYTERDKAYVLDRQTGIMADVLPEYRAVAEGDGGELTVTPMYHPILPLLISSNAAKDASPGAPLPKVPFSHPADALEQLRRGKDCFRSLLGMSPRGVWPSEGSISPAALKLIAECGFEWTATDEILLAKSLGKPVLRDAEGIPLEPDWLYAPYRAQMSTGGEIGVFFRDHHLSDLIGFEYSRWDGRDAVTNFTAKLVKIYDRLQGLPAATRKGSYVVPIILDGENAWEYFPDSGWTFLRMLMGRCAALAPNISFITLSEAYNVVDNIRYLETVPTGSWIDGTFGIWIGHAEDRAAWETLARARNLFQINMERNRRAGLGLSENLAAAYENLLVAEGSDWCWWYGDDHFTPHALEFDRLFRHHIKAAYRAMGEIPPDSLDLPLTRLDRVPLAANRLSAPRTYIRPKIDGRISSYFEWSAASRHIPSPEFGAMHRAGHGILSSLYYGFDESTLYLRADFHGSAFEVPVAVEVDFVFPAKDRKVSLVLYPDDRTIRAHMGRIEDIPDEDHAVTKPEIITAAFHDVLELGVPFQELGCENDARIDFFVTIQPKGSIGERWPMYGNFDAELPGEDFEERMWEA